MNKEKEIKLDDAERQKCEVWERCMGYFRPIDNWNIGKRQEHADRKYFSEKKAAAHVAEMAAE